MPVWLKYCFTRWNHLIKHSVILYSSVCKQIGSLNELITKNYFGWDCLMAQHKFPFIGNSDWVGDSISKWFVVPTTKETLALDASLILAQFIIHWVHTNVRKTIIKLFLFIWQVIVIYFYNFGQKHSQMDIVSEHNKIQHHLIL